MSRAKGTAQSGGGGESLNDLSSLLDNVLRGFVQLLEGASNLLKQCERSF